MDGKTWQKIGAMVEVAPGLHVVSFKPVTGWQKPASKTVKIPSEQTKTVEASYVKSTP